MSVTQSSSLNYSALYHIKALLLNSAFDQVAILFVECPGVHQCFVYPHREYTHHYCMCAGIHISWGYTYHGYTCHCDRGLALHKIICEIKNIIIRSLLKLVVLYL